MALFQVSVLKSHLAQLDEATVEKAYKKYQKYFWNTSIQDNIKTAKEEQYQATFLNELFVNILDYTLFPNPNPNLTTEFKNEKNARKADGAILKDDKAIGVIELKGTKTKDLESIRRQAFDYKANQKGCVYVITSNFEKLRFYINDATEFEEFNLFSLTQQRFNLLYLCLHKDKVLKNIPLKIKEASIAKEEEITKAFYKDYSIFKRELYRDLVKKNAKTVKEKLVQTENIEDQDDINRLEKNAKLTLFQKSQKLIDRFLFIFFAEDRMLLPSNSTLQILNKWKDDWDFGDERPLYDLFKQYFNFLDIGRKGTARRAEIYAYNGGLFKPDAILDALEMDNDLLYKHTLKLSNYDFDSQVDVNILGHIFENSLNEIESVNAEIEGGEFDKQTSKRKKDGVFYTPKYITKYIVENTVGKLCDEKKQELGFDEEQYFKGRKNRNKATIEKLVGILDTYRNWLLKITICDPACGSGAFLNQALDFLIKEHSYIDELKARVLGAGLQFPDIENTILENNIYGVDLNEESVEIAKLSLWLRTAQPRRKLNNLSSNIKCGNSLIDSKSVAGDKAFKWENEFPQVFKEKQKHAYHLVFTTHNSRISQRMLKYKVKKGEPLLLNLEQEIALTEIIHDIVKENNYPILAYNICKDHIHLIVVCEEEEVPNIAKTLKGKSSHEYQSKGFKPLGEPLWSQKYFFANLADLSLPSVSNQAGHVFVDTYKENALAYVKHNRSKHNLPKSDKLNGIIDNMLTDQDTAFTSEYNNGFDVVIGNPPYVNANQLKKAISKNEYSFLKSNYKTAKGTVDLYIYFFEKGLNLLSHKGILSYITPNRFLSASYGKALREMLVNEFEISGLVDYSDKKVFVDASTYPVISFLRNKSNDTYNVVTGHFEEESKQVIQSYFSSEKLNVLEDYILGFLLNDKLKITEKIINQSDRLNSCGKINATSTASEADDYSKLITQVNEGFKLINTGTIDPYSNTWGIEELTDKGKKYIKPYLPINSEEISKNRNELYSTQKIIISKIGLKCEAFFDREGHYASINTNCIHSFKNNFIPEYILCWINSKLYNYMFECFFDGLRMSGGYLLFSAPNLRNTYIKSLPLTQQNPFEKLSQMIELAIREFLKVKNNLSSYINSKFSLLRLSRKLENWHELDFGDFIKELNKAIKATNKTRAKDNQEPIPALTKKDEFEWMELFEENKKKAQELQTQITATEKEIDQMVYELYGLTEEEIEVVEKS